jgi:hypothetical protein
MASARRDERNPAHKRAQAPLRVTLGMRARPLLQVAGDVHPLDPAPDTDPEAGLRCIDAAALRAPPHRHTLERLVPINVLGFDLRIAAQRDPCHVLRRPIRRLPLLRSRLTQRELLGNGTKSFRPNTTAGLTCCERLVPNGRHKLELLLAAATITRPEPPHRPAPNTRRHRDTIRR